MVELEFSQALEVPGKQFVYTFNLPLSVDNDIIAPNKIVGDANVSLTYFADYDSVLHLKGTIRVPCKFMCDRCGAGFEKYLFLELDEKVSPKMSEEDELSYDMPTIILDDIISTFFIMNFPSKILCSENCKGLCDKCGQNLNDGECDCFKNRVGKNNPFADLLNSKKLGGN